MNSPNVVLICVDQWRGDCLGAAGHPTVATPYLDQLAADGARFERAYSATPSCIPARAALYTGLFAKNNGRVGDKDGVDWDYPTTIASEFTRNGYQTQAIGKLHVFPERSQIGFQNVILHDGYLPFARRGGRDLATIDDYIPWLRRETGDPAADDFTHGLNRNAPTARPWDRDERLHPSNWLVSEAIGFLRRRDPRKPFFLYLGFHRPHPPFDPPAWAFEQYFDSESPDPPVGAWWADILGPYRDDHRADPSVASPRPAMLRRARAGYYGLMTQIDHQLNRFFESLQAWGLRNNTIFCFVSDHGEMLGDHNAWRKSLPYEGSARVPFLLSGPGIARGVVRREPVELCDVFPSLLDAAGLKVPAGLDGKSVLPLLVGDRSGWREFLHGEHIVFGQSVHYLTDGDEKYIWWSGTGREQLFALTLDPQERQDHGQDLRARSRVTLWRKRLVECLKDRPEGFVDNGKLVAGRPVRPLIGPLAQTYPA